jgi:hypothetical protein
MAESNQNWYSVSLTMSRDDDWLPKGLPQVGGRHFGMYRFILVPLPGHQIALHEIVLARPSLVSYRNLNTSIERRVRESTSPLTMFSE